MREAFVLRVMAVALACLGAAGSVAAQPDIRVEVEGLQPDTDVQVVLAFANLNKSEPAVATGGGGSLDFISDFANMGKTASAAAEPTQVYVYYDRCEDPDQILFSDTPRDDEECRDPIGIIFISSRTTGIIANAATGSIRTVESGTMPRGLFGGGGGPGLTVGVSIDFNQYPDAEESPLTSELEGLQRLRRTSDLKSSGADLDLSVEYWIAPWLGAGFGYERMGEVRLSESFDFPEVDDLRQTFDGFFNVQSVDFVVKPALPIGDKVKVFAIAGVMKWWGEAGSSSDLIFEGDVVDSFSVRQDVGGVAGVFGAGVVVWPTNVVGFSVYYKQAQLKDDDNVGDEQEVDERFRKFGVAVTFNLWGR